MITSCGFTTLGIAPDGLVCMTLGLAGGAPLAVGCLLLSRSCEMPWIRRGGTEFECLREGPVARDAIRKNKTFGIEFDPPKFIQTRKRKGLCNQETSVRKHLNIFLIKRSPTSKKSCENKISFWEEKVFAFKFNCFTNSNNISLYNIIFLVFKLQIVCTCHSQSLPAKLLRKNLLIRQTLLTNSLFLGFPIFGKYGKKMILPQVRYRSFNLNTKSDTSKISSPQIYVSIYRNVTRANLTLT